MVAAGAHTDNHVSMMEDATVLAGTLASAATPAHIAARVPELREYRALFPEAEFVFVGDAGQADAPSAR